MTLVPVAVERNIKSVAVPWAEIRSNNMGFGIMFLGYFFMYIGSFTALSTYTAIVGAAVILFSLKELIYQNKCFLASAIVAILLVFDAIAVVFVDLFLSDTSLAYSILFYARDILSAILNVMLMVSILLISKEVKLSKIQAKSIITILFIGIYVIFTVLCNTVFGNNELMQSRFYPVSVVCQFIAAVLGLVTVFNSYMRICYEDDKDMTKKTGVSPMDFLNDKLNMAMTPKEKRMNNDRKKKK
jgi:hypothetical protein